MASTRRKHTRVGALFLGLALGVSACTAASDNVDSVRSTTASSTATASTSPAGSAATDDVTTEPVKPEAGQPETLPLAQVTDTGPVADSLLLIRTEAQSSTVVRLEVRGRDGALVTDLTEASSGRSFLPTWSTDGRWIAWAQLGDGGDWILVVTDIEGNRRSEAPLSGRPDYLAFEDWVPEPPNTNTDPAVGPRIYALVGGPSGFGMVSVDPIQGRLSFEVARGAPLFFDQAPNSPLVAVQVDDRTAVVDGSAPGGTVIDLRRGRVTSVLPIWNPVDANEVLFADSNDASAGGVLQRRDLASGENVQVLTYGAGLQVDPSPNGDRLAVVVGPSFGGVDDPFNDPDVISVVFEASQTQDNPTTSPTLDETGLWQLDTTTGVANLLTTRRSSIPQWDPTSTWAVVLHPNGASRPTWAAYSSTGAVVETPPVTVSTAAAGNYLAFWDQFSQNHSMWSNDGSAFVFAGVVDGTDGVWLQTLDATAPVFVSTGSTAFFSPT